MNTQDELEKIEEEFREKELEEEKTHHKVSGKSVFELQDIIKKKSEKSQEKIENL